MVVFMEESALTRVHWPWSLAFCSVSGSEYSESESSSSRVGWPKKVSMRVYFIVVAI